MQRPSLSSLFLCLLLCGGCASVPDHAETGGVCFVPAPPPERGDEVHSDVLSREAAQACLERVREVGISAFSDESRPLTQGVLLAPSPQGASNPQEALKEAKARAREQGARWLVFVWLARIDAADAETAEPRAYFRGKGFQLFDLHRDMHAGVGEGLPDGPPQAFEGYSVLDEDDPRSGPLAREEGLSLMERFRSMNAGFRRGLEGTPK